MAESQQSSNKKESQVIFSTKKMFEIQEGRTYDNFMGKWYTWIEATIDGNRYSIKIPDFDEILTSLRRKIIVLKYVNDETYESIAKDILIDIAKLIYKLESGDKV